MKKKVVAVVLLICMSLGCFSGCKSKNNGDTKSETKAENSVDQTKIDGKVYASAHYFEEIISKDRESVDKTTFCDLKNVDNSLLAGADEIFPTTHDTYEPTELSGAEVEGFIKNLQDYWQFLAKNDKKHENSLPASKADWVSFQMDNNKVLSIMFEGSDDPGDWFALYGDGNNADTGFVVNVEGNIRFSSDGKTLTYTPTHDACNFYCEAMWGALPEEDRSETTIVMQCNHDLFVRIDGGEFSTEEQAIERTKEIVSLFKTLPDQGIERVYISYVINYTRERGRTNYEYNFSTFCRWDDPDNVDVRPAGFYPIEYDIARNYVFNE